MKKIKFIFILAVILFLVYQGFKFFSSEKNLKVIFLSGKVYLDNSEKKELVVGDPVPNGVPVKLDTESLCFLQTPEGAVIKLSSEASVKIQESKTTSLELTEGSLEYIGKEKKTAPPALVSTPHATLAMESKHCFIRTDKGQSTVSVYEGKVTVKTGNEKVVVKADEGALLVKGSDPIVSSLPSIPKIQSPENDIKVENYIVVANVSEISDASYYLWEYSLSPNFTQITMEQTSKKNKADLRRPPKDGNYFLRVRAVNSNGISSSPSEPVKFEYHFYGKIKKLVDYTHNFYINQQYQECIDSAKKCLAICPDHVNVQKELGLSLLKINSREEAIKVAHELKKNSWPEAKKDFQEVVKEIASKYPNDPALKELKK